MGVLVFAKSRQAESDLQASLGEASTEKAVQYWTNYIEGAEAIRSELKKDFKPILDQTQSVIPCLRSMIVDAVGLLGAMDQDEPAAEDLIEQITAIDVAIDALVKLSKHLADGTNADAENIAAKYNSVSNRLTET